MALPDDGRGKDLLKAKLLIYHINNNKKKPTRMLNTYELLDSSLESVPDTGETSFSVQCGQASVWHSNDIIIFDYLVNLRKVYVYQM